LPWGTSRSDERLKKELSKPVYRNPDFLSLIIGKDKIMKTVSFAMLLLVLAAGGCKKDEEATTAP
jgi:hypothetical protein